MVKVLKGTNFWGRCDYCYHNNNVHPVEGPDSKRICDRCIICENKGHFFSGKNCVRCGAYNPSGCKQ